MRGLVLVQGGKGLEGPISRMGLWERFEPVCLARLSLILGMKALLLGLILYYFPL